MWEYWIHDLRTGAPQLQVYPSDVSWTRRLNARGDGQFTFRVTDRTSIPRFGAGHELVRPNDRVIVVRWGTHVAYAGYVREWEYAQGAQVRVSTGEIRGILARRYTGRPDAYGSLWNLSYTNRSASGAVNTILSRSVSLAEGYSLPLVLPPHTAGELSRQIRFYETLSIDDALREVEDSGAQVDFEPTLTTDGHLRWQVTVGDIDRGVVDLVVGAPQSPVTGLTVRVNGDKQASGVLALGKGQGEDMMTAYATDGSANVPALVQKVDAKDFDRVEEVARVAQQAITDAVWPVEQWSFGLNLEHLDPALVRPGMRVRVDVRGDVWIPDGQREFQVTALSGDLTMQVSPEVVARG